MATNKEIINKVTQEMPAEHAEKISGLMGIDLLNVFEQFPTTRNSFIDTLTNRVTKSLIYSKIYENQLKELKKGMLAFGDSIEELFVQMAQVKGFTANWDETANTPEADLIRKLVPKVSALYTQVNVDYKSKTTVTEKQMRKAFLNEGGLQSLVGQIVGSITSAMEFKEFNFTKTALNKLISDGQTITGLNDDATPIFGGISINGAIKQTPYIYGVTDNAGDFSVAIRETVGNMKFPSTKYNLAGELNWTIPNDLILLTTPSVIAKLDVHTLANAFNVSMADLNTRTILVDEMPSGVFQKTGVPNVDRVPTFLSSGDTIENNATLKVKAILMDKDLLQIWDTSNNAGTFFNPEGVFTNYFANREGIFATCLFANFAVFYELV